MTLLDLNCMAEFFIKLSLVTLKKTSTCFSKFLSNLIIGQLSRWIMDVTQYTQYLNYRGEAGGRVPPSRVSVPPLRFRCPPIESWALDNQKKNSHPGLKDPTNFLPKMVATCGEDLFFGLHLISGKNASNFRRRTFSCFSSSFNFGDENTSFPLNFL